MRRIDVAAAQVEYDESDPEGFRSGGVQTGPDLGATETGVSVYELPPGQALCPYHYEQAEEEWLLVLTGRPTLRDPDGDHQLAAHDLVFFPVGPGGAHGVRNATGETVRVLMFSTVHWPAVSVYPDSDKVGVYVRDKAESLIVPRGAAVEYWHGETSGE